MIESTEPLFNKEQTAKRIRDLVNEYHTDLNDAVVSKEGKFTPLLKMSVVEYFNFVKNIPYRKDKAPFEIVSRPYHILKHSGLGMDCKKKAILMASYCKNHGIPYRFIGSSKRADKKVHHIFVQALLDGQWKNLDATYDYFKPFQQKQVTHAEVL